MKRKWLISIAVLIFGIGIGTGLLLRGEDPSKSHDHGGSSDGISKAEVWTCSMHPQIRQSGPGKCPLCGMDLIPVKADSEKQDNPRTLKLSESARALAGIQTSRVSREFIPVEVRMTGKIAYDETRFAYITARMPGRVDRMFVNYSGIPIKKGDHMVYFYSPALFTAQEELLQALKAETSASTGTLKKEAGVLVQAARSKLRLWDISDRQIREIEKRGTASEYMTIHAPLGGIVIGKHVEEGTYVQTGMKIYTIADLTKLWVFLDAYESDLQWIKYGQKAVFTTEAYPGREFSGRVSFIDPVLNAKTRTVRVRITVSNNDGHLKPEMFVRAIVKATVTDDGAVVERDLAGKWICPMHPEVVKDEPGSCDDCGMPLVSAESLGYVDKGENDNPPLVIPASAPLITGKRAVVYIRKDSDSDLFEGREIVLGPRAGKYYIVESGLSEGDLVVTNGNFKIDSALQILARPSMMSPEDETLQSGHNHGSHDNMELKPEHMIVPEAFLKDLNPLFDSYFLVQKALAGDDFKTGHDAAGKFHGTLDSLDTAGLSADQLRQWDHTKKLLLTAAGKLHSAKHIEELRLHFSTLSELMSGITRSFGYAGNSRISLFTCPMAFNNRGARWLQNSSELKNPYFGKAMLKCGDKLETISPRGLHSTHKKEANHEQ